MGHGSRDFYYKWSWVISLVAEYIPVILRAMIFPVFTMDTLTAMIALQHCYTVAITGVLCGESIIMAVLLIAFG